jgi:hypothetical protein
VVAVLDVAVPAHVELHRAVPESNDSAWRRATLPNGQIRPMMVSGLRAALRPEPFLVPPPNTLPSR